MATEDKGSMPSNSNLDISLGKRHRKVENRFQLFRHIGGTIAIVVSIVTLIVGGIEFYIQQQQSQQQALDQQRQTTLDTYFDRMQELLLMRSDDFKAYKPGDEFQALAVARTLTALRNLDGSRKGYLIRFLWGAQLINEPNPILHIQGADLSGAVFAVPNEEVDLSRVSLANDNLLGADLSHTDLQEANLSGADLSCMNQSGKQICVNLTGAFLSGAKLNDANLSGANLSMACLGSNRATSTSNPIVSTACLGPPPCTAIPTCGGIAPLIGADLSGAKNLTQQQLDQASYCLGATLPQGIICHHNQI